MFQKFFWSMFALTIALFVVACSSEQPTSSVSMATLEPTSVTAVAQSDSLSTTTTKQGVDTATALPQTLADVQEGQVYTFNVDPSQTTVEYAVDEVLFGNTQVTRGSTSDVAGEFTLEVKDGKPVVSLSELQVDLRTLASDNNMRDGILHSQWLESDKYPMAIFVAKSVEGLPADAVQGKAYTFKVTGDMTIRNITKEVTFDVTVTLDGTTLTGQGTTQIYMKDFGFDPPEMLGRFTVSDPATITVKGVANLSEG